MRQLFFSLIVFFGACDGASGHTQRSPDEIFRKQAGQPGEVTLAVEYRDAGWRNVRNVLINLSRGGEKGRDVLAYWICNHSTFIVPTTYTPVTEERRTALGLRSGMGDEVSPAMQRGGNELGQFFELDREGAKQLVDALSATCKQVPSFVEPPVNILMSFSDSGDLTHFEAANFVRNGSLASAWERHEDFEKAKAADDTEEVWVLSNPTPMAKGLVQYDCSKRSLERQTLVFFNRDGSYNETLTGGLKIPQVVPGTTDEANLETACLFE
jgi:hypothetical protein